MTPDRACTQDLLYADYRYKHCDGDCYSCPCYNDDFDCSETHKEIMVELDRRE